jgi:signal transduction histidine kinase
LWGVARRLDQIQFLIAEDIAHSDLPTFARELILGDGVHSMIYVPLRTHGRLVGLVVYGSRPIRHFSRSDLSFMITTADLFAVAIENARLYEEIRGTLRLREEFMSAAAHELRSPVTVIKGRAQLALKVDALEGVARHALEDILRASERIIRLTDDLLAGIQVRSDLVRLNRQPFDLTELTRGAVEQTRRGTAQHEFRAIAGGSLVVDADRGLIGEVLNRLLENARRYSPGGGVIEVEAHRDDRWAVVSVTDHGVGISPKRQAHVFEPFYELIGAGEPGYIGMVSLGLFLSKQIIDAHGGRIWFVSQPSRGSTFSFKLPLA